MGISSPNPNSAVWWFSTFRPATQSAPDERALLQFGIAWQALFMLPPESIGWLTRQACRMREAQDGFRSFNCQLQDIGLGFFSADLLGNWSNCWCWLWGKEVSDSRRSRNSACTISGEKKNVSIPYHRQRGRIPDEFFGMATKWKRMVRVMRHGCLWRQD